MKSFAGWRVRRDAASEPEKPLRDELLSIDRLEERALAGDRDVLEEPRPIPEGSLLADDEHESVRLMANSGTRE